MHGILPRQIQFVTEGFAIGFRMKSSQMPRHRIFVCYKLEPVTTAVGIVDVSIGYPCLMGVLIAIQKCLNLLPSYFVEAGIFRFTFCTGQYGLPSRNKTSGAFQ